jgi:membrane-associated protein
MLLASATASTASAVLANPISPDKLLSSSGLAVLAIVLFAETGLLIGFFLPGDTLLFAAGIKIATDPGHMSSLTSFLIVAPIAAIVGNLVGYAIGYRAGPVVFDRPNSRLFRPEYVSRSREFFDRFGSWTIILGRFVPIVRTVATVMAGVARMRFSLYTLYSIIGGILWADGVLLLGHQLGKVKFVRDHKGYVDYAVIAVLILALLPTLIHYLRGRRSTR